MNYLLDIKSAFLPEIIIFAFILINVILSIFLSKKHYKISRLINLLGILISIYSISFLQAEPTYTAFNGSILSNICNVFFKCLILINSFFIILISFKTIKKQKNKAFEYFAVLFSTILGALILTCSNNFLVAFLSLELMSINGYFLSSFSKNNKAQNYNLKQIINSFIPTTFFLLGTSYIYGICGTINFDTITTTLIGYQSSFLYIFSVILILFSIALKTNIISFNKTNTDIFETSTYPVVIFLSTIPKIAGFAFLLKLIILFYNYAPIISLVIIIMAIISLLFNIAKLFQTTNIKTFFACSAYAQSALILILLALPSTFNITGLLYCLIYYLFTNLALGAGITSIYNSTKRNDLNIYKGIGYKLPFFTTTIILTIFALCGFPPTSGFWARFFIFSSQIRLGFYYIPFLLITMFLTIMLIFTYFRPIKIMLERNNNNKIQFFTPIIFSKIIFYFCAIITILLCFYSEKIIELCELIAYSI